MIRCREKDVARIVRAGANTGLLVQVLSLSETSDDGGVVWLVRSLQHVECVQCFRRGDEYVRVTVMLAPGSEIRCRDDHLQPLPRVSPKEVSELYGNQPIARLQEK